MTIAGLWDKYIEYEAGDERRPLRIYAEQFYKKHGRPLSVGIDGFMWLFELKPPEQSGTAHQNVEKLKTNFHARIRDLIRMNVSFVFVFDGNFKDYKRRWDSGDAVREDRAADDTANFDDKYAESIRRIRDKNWNEVGGGPYVVKLKQLLTRWNISWVEAPGEAEAELGRLNCCGTIDAVITNDSDCFMFGAQTVLRNCSKWRRDAPSSSNTGNDNGPKENELYVTPFRLEKITEKTGLTKERIVFVAALSGNDFSGGAKDFGITRAVALAQVGTDADMEIDDLVDFAAKVKEICVGNNNKEYVAGRPPYSFTERKQKWKQFSELLNSEIGSRSKDYFGRLYTLKGSVPLPPDFYFMNLFYPLLAPTAYRFSQFETNCANLQPYDGFRPEQCIMPQPAALDADGQFIRSSEGNVAGGGIMNWFERPDFKAMCKNSSKEDMRAFLVKNLTEAYLFRIIACLARFRVDKQDVQVTSEKILRLPTKHKAHDDENFKPRWESEHFQVVFYPEKLFGQYLPEQDLDEMMDENYVMKPEKASKAWVPKYLLESVRGGRTLLREYEEEQQRKQEEKEREKKEKQEAKEKKRQERALARKNKGVGKASPTKRRRRYPPQNSTLFSLTNSRVRLVKENGGVVANDVVNEAVGEAENKPISPPAAPQFTPSRPGSSDSAEQVHKRSKSGEFWTDSRKSKDSSGLGDWFGSDSRPRLSQSSPKKSGLTVSRAQSKGSQMDAAYRQLVPAGPEAAEEPGSVVEIGSEDEAEGKTAEDSIMEIGESTFLGEDNSSDGLDELDELLGLTKAKT